MRPVALRYTSIIKVRLRMPGRVDHGDICALLELAGSAPPKIATSAQAIVRYPRAAASSSFQRFAPDGRRDRLERRFEERDVVAISDGCYLDSTFFTGANDPVEPECLSPLTAGRNSPPRGRRTVAAVLCASLLGLGLAFFACTLLIPALRLDWSDVVCLGGNSNPPQMARTNE
jgi:uncharacterized membrane protein YbhN (UPF0104 family)